MPPREDKEPLGEFRYITYGQIDRLDELHPLYHRYLSKDKYKRLIDCPDIADDFPWFFYIADEQRIYSHLSAIPDVLRAGEKSYRWAWTGDLVTDPKYRGRGLAKRVVEETIKVLHQHDYIAGGGFATEVTIHIYKKLGFDLPGFVTRRLYLKTLRPVLQYHLKSKSIRAIIDGFYRALVLLSRPLIRLRTGRIGWGISVRELVPAIEESRRTDLPGLRYQARFHFNDSLNKVLWKIAWTRHDTKLYVMTNEQTGGAVGYFVVREKQVTEPILGRYTNFKLMTLMDYGFYGDDAGLHRALLGKLFGLFRGSDADVLEVVSSSALLNGCARRMGMRRVGKGVPFLLLAPADWSLGADAGDTANWHLTHYSGEGFLMR
jgi:GNAT superfamily N-acetyltransferase